MKRKLTIHITRDRLKTLALFMEVTKKLIKDDQYEIKINYIPNLNLHQDNESIGGGIFSLFSSRYRRNLDLLKKFFPAVEILQKKSSIVDLFSSILTAFKVYKEIRSFHKYSDIVRYSHPSGVDLSSCFSTLSKYFSTSDISLIIKKYKYFIIKQFTGQILTNKYLTLSSNNFLESYTHLVFNGRNSVEAVIKNLATQNSRKIIYIEAGFTKKNYFYGQGIMPVSMERYAKSRVKKFVPYDLDFLKKYCSLLTSIEPKNKKYINKKDVLVFLTSPYEYVMASKEWVPQGGDWTNQDEMIDKLYFVCRKNKLNLYIKPHPNDPENTLERLNSRFLKKPGVSLINDNITSHVNLAQGFKYVLVSSSSVAVDIAMHGKAVGFTLPSYYEKSEIGSRIKTIQDLLIFFDNPSMFMKKNYQENAAYLKLFTDSTDLSHRYFFAENDFEMFYLDEYSKTKKIKFNDNFNKFCLRLWRKGSRRILYLL